ncbi:MAG: 1-deoxy-D-xylulose-5-phosphate synthase, partial [Rickettsiales bacterium]
AINNLVSAHSRIIIILNDNEMSISKPVGAVSGHLSNMDDQNNLFTNLGIHYVGKIDGHNISELINVFRTLKDNKSINKPILIHVKTEKAKGFKSDIICNEQWHAVGPSSKNIEKDVKKNKTYTNVFSDVILDIAEKDDKIIAITAAMSSGTGLTKFSKKFPNRFFDVAISEQHAVTFASGLAASGMKPFVAIYSTFLQRAYDQIIHDVAIQKMPVRFAIDRAGFVGADGPTHSGSFDIAFLSIVPNIIIMAPSDENELASMIKTAAVIDYAPSAFRYPRGEGVGVDYSKSSILEIGKAKIVNEGNNIAIFSVGTRLADCILAKEELKNIHDIDITIIDVRFIKPIDYDLINIISKSHQYIITIEEGSMGGFGSMLLNYLINN